MLTKHCAQASASQGRMGELPLAALMQPKGSRGTSALQPPKLKAGLQAEPGGFYDKSKQATGHGKAKAAAPAEPAREGKRARKSPPVRSRCYPIRIL